MKTLSASANTMEITVQADDDMSHGVDRKRSFATRPLEAAWADLQTRTNKPHLNQRYRSAMCQSTNIAHEPDRGRASVGIDELGRNK